MNALSHNAAPFARGPAGSSGVSVVIPAYRSDRTLARCLAALQAQTQPPLETLVVDSSPDEACARVVAEHPGVTVLRSPYRLVPHAAQNAGAARTRGDLLVFLDPDAYPEPDWLERLVAFHLVRARSVTGAIACFGGAGLDLAIHLCKFGAWLPGGGPRPVAVAPSTNLLVSRRDFDRAGGFGGTPFLGDVELSRRLAASGEGPWLEPSAVVAHHHQSRLGAFLRERVERGRGYGALRATFASGARRGALAAALVAGVPVRLSRILWRSGRDARRAGLLTAYLRGLPVIFAGHGAFLAGEAAGILGALGRPGTA